MTTSRRNKRSPSCMFSLIFPILGFLLISALVSVSALARISERTESLFGPPAPHVLQYQRLAYSVLLFWQAKDLTQPVEPVAKEHVFRVEQGESVPSITGRLYQQGLISNPGAFRTYLLYSGLDTSIQAGNYTLTSAMSSMEIAHALQDATPTHVTLNVLPGWRLEEIAASLPTSGLNISPDQFLFTARILPPGSIVSGVMPDLLSVEGFLFPDAYTVERTLTSEELVTLMLENFEQKLTGDLRKGFERQGLSIYEAVTLASIVEREAVAESDMPLIASVFYNRLAVDMKLDSDPTVQYAIGFNAAQNTWWTNPLSLDDLKFDAAYNTYLYNGLPPGPIANPSIKALRAVAFPAQTPYYYFRAGCNDAARHLFAETFEQHVKNACP